MYTLDQLRCFVAVAEELHFGRAATRLHMTQPPLSRQIQKLERDLEFQLLHRDAKGVALTLAGESFLRECYLILEQAETAPKRAKLIAEGRAGLLTIGYTAIAGFSLLGEVLQELNTGLPDLEIHLQELVTPQQIEALESGSIDLGLGRPPFLSDSLSSTTVLKDRLSIVVPKGHELAEHDGPISISEIQTYPLVMYSPNDAQYFHRLLTDSLGLDPNMGRYQVTQVVTIIALVSSGHGIAVVPASAIKLGNQAVEFLRIKEPESPTVELHAVWKVASVNPALAPALSIIDAIKHEH